MNKQKTLMLLRASFFYEFSVFPRKVLLKQKCCYRDIFFSILWIEESSFKLCLTYSVFECCRFFRILNEMENRMFQGGVCGSVHKLCQVFWNGFLHKWRFEHVNTCLTSLMDKFMSKTWKIFFCKFFEIWMFFSENQKIKNQNTSFKLINQS